MEIVPAECQSTTIDRACAFRESGFIFEEKMDGIRAVVQVGAGSNRVTGRRFSDDGKPAEITKAHAAYLRAVRFDGMAGCAFDGELMPDGSYWIFDCLAWCGRDLRREHLGTRKGFLGGLSLPEFVSVLPWFDSIQAVGEFGEGVVIKDLRSEYGHGWWKAKRVESADVCVVAVDYDTGTARIGFGGCITGVPPSVIPGDLIEVEFSKQFKSGALRNGRFVRIRDDKDVRNVDSRKFARVSASS